MSVSITDLLIVFAVFLAILIIPAIPGIVLLFFLHPHTFWEKLAWVLTSSSMYTAILVVLVASLDV